MGQNACRRVYAVSNTFMKRLRREATANPKKAGILAALLLVAAYFWAPLVRQWTSSSTESTETAVAATSASVPVQTPPQTSPSVPVAGGQPPSSPPTRASVDWRQLASAIDQDPRMRPVGPNDQEISRDPFVAPARPEVETAVGIEESLATEEKTPTELGLFLSGTIVGPSRRTAVVNGKVYVSGGELKAAEGTVFIVRQIEPWGIVLERSGQQFEVALPRPRP